MQHRRLIFSKLKLSYILIYNYTANKQTRERKKELSKKKNKKRKKERVTNLHGHWAVECSGWQTSRRKWQWWKARDASSFGSQ